MIFQNDNELLQRITIDSGVLLGKPTIRGFRISVDHILKAMAAGRTFAELKQEYTFLEEKDIQACLLYASKLLEDERVYSITV